MSVASVLPDGGKLKLQPSNYLLTLWRMLSIIALTSSLEGRLAGFTGRLAAGTARGTVVLELLLPELPCTAGSCKFSSPQRARRSIVNNQPTGLLSLPSRSCSRSMSANAFASASGSEAIWVVSICRSSLFSPLTKSSGKKCSPPGTYVFLFTLCVKERTLQSEFRTPV